MLGRILSGRAAALLMCAVGVALLVAGCAGIVSSFEDASAPETTQRNATQLAPAGADASVTGTITYDEDIRLTPGAVVTVQLRDVSLQDVSSILISEQIINNPGQVPISFEVRYASDEIEERNTYGISAVITEADGRLAFVNDWAYDVITWGNPTHVNMTLAMVEPPPGWSPEN